jgi:hypothetical protein
MDDSIIIVRRRQEALDHAAQILGVRPPVPSAVRCSANFALKLSEKSRQASNGRTASRQNRMNESLPPLKMHTRTPF